MNLDPNEIDDRIKVRMIHLSNEKWEEFKNDIKDIIVNYDDLDSESIALGCKLGDIPYIIIAKERFDKLDEDFKWVILAHESAHAVGGILDEEEADRWALETCRNDIQRDLLIDNWEHRHGHPYKEK